MQIRNKMKNKNTWQSQNGVYIIAEIGGNHEGDFAYAKKLTKLAVESGADAVKFQIYTGDKIVSKVENPQRNKHFKKFELSKKQYLQLADYCNENKVSFMASVWSVDAIDWIDPYLDFYKIGSGDLTAYPLLKEFAKRGKPIILSTGLSTSEEVENAVKYIQSVNEIYKQKENLAVLQCTSMYPIPEKEANLNVMNYFRDKFELTIGYSDHTTGTYAAEISVAMGAEIVEVHFTDTRENKTFRDHKVSFTKKEIKELIKRTKRIRTLQGSEQKTPTFSEIESNHLITFRRSVYAKKAIKKGTILTENLLTVLRPNTGIDAREFDLLIGKKLINDKIANEKILKKDIE